MRFVRNAAIGGGVAVLAFLGAPAAYACSICNPEGVAVTTLLATGTEAGASVAVPAALAASVETAVTAVTVGEATSIGVTGLVGVGAAVGIPMLIGGMGDWKWGSNGTGLPLPPLGGSGAKYYGDYVPDASPAPDYVWTGTTNGLSWSYAANTAGYQHWWSFCRNPAVVPNPTDPVWAYNLTKPASSWSPVTNTPGYTLSGYNPNNMTSTTYSVATACGGGSVPAFAVFWRDGLGASNGGKTWGVNANQLVIVPDYVPTVANPSDPYPGRTIQQTVTCKTKGGTTYTRNVSTDIATGLNGTPITIAGVMCDPSDLATAGSAVVKSPGKPDTVLNGEVSTAPRWADLPEAARFAAADATTDHTWTFTAEKPGESKVPLIEPGNPSIPPGTDTGTGTSFCGMEFGDLLNGKVIFKAFGCALSWAFVPSSGFLATTETTMSNAWNGSGLGQFVQSASGIVSSFSQLGQSGQARAVAGKTAAAAPAGLPAGLPAGVDQSAPLCRGPVFELPLGAEPVIVTPLNACDEPMQSVAYWVKVILTIMCFVGASMMVLNMVLDGLRMVTLADKSQGKESLF